MLYSCTMATAGVKGPVNCVCRLRYQRFQSSVLAMCHLTFIVSFNVLVRGSNLWTVDDSWYSVSAYNARCAATGRRRRLVHYDPARRSSRLGQTSSTSRPRTTSSPVTGLSSSMLGSEADRAAEENTETLEQVRLRGLSVSSCVSTASL